MDDFIFKYTDKQAVEDGVLVDLADWGMFLNEKVVSRISINLWEELKESIKDKSGDEKKQLIALRGIILEKIRQAKITPDNPDGYMFILPNNIWAVANEIGGYTLMLPQDY